MEKHHWCYHYVSASHCGEPCQVELSDSRTLVIDAETYSGIPHIEVSVLEAKKVNPRIAAFTDDLTASQFQEMLTWLMGGHYAIVPSNIKEWRRKAGLPVNRED